MPALAWMRPQPAQALQVLGSERASVWGWISLASGADSGGGHGAPVEGPAWSAGSSAAPRRHSGGTGAVTLLARESLPRPPLPLPVRRRRAHVAAQGARLREMGAYEPKGGGHNDNDVRELARRGACTVRGSCCSVKSVSIFSKVNVYASPVRSQGLGNEGRAYLKFLVVDENAVYIFRRPS